MLYRKDKYGNEISQLGYGCMRFTRKGSGIDYEKAEKELMLAVERASTIMTQHIYIREAKNCSGAFLMRTSVEKRCI